MVPVMYSGRVTVLRTATEADLPLLMKWHSDSDLVEISYGRMCIPPSFVDIRDRYMKPASSEHVNLVLANLEGRLVGMAEIYAIRWTHGHCRVGIAIGDRADWGKGYGKDGLALLYRIAFEGFNMHRVYSEVLEHNQSIRRIAITLGAREVGSKQQGAYFGGRWHNLVVLSTSPEGYRSASSTYWGES